MLAQWPYRLRCSAALRIACVVRIAPRRLALPRISMHCPATTIAWQSWCSLPANVWQCGHPIHGNGNIAHNARIGLHCSAMPPLPCIACIAPHRCAVSRIARLALQRLALPSWSRCLAMHGNAGTHKGCPDDRCCALFRNACVVRNARVVRVAPRCSHCPHCSALLALPALPHCVPGRCMVRWCPGLKR